MGDRIQRIRARASVVRVERMPQNEFEYVTSISETLEAGKWIAVVDKDIIKGDSAKEVFGKIRAKYPSREPFIMKVPDNSLILL